MRTFGAAITLAFISLACDGTAEPCSVSANGDNTFTLSCPDGTSVTWREGGPAGEDAEPCSVSDDGNGSFTLTCPDGTSATWESGEIGPRGNDGTACTVASSGDGTNTISCDDGTEVILRDGAAGAPGSSCTVFDNGNGTSTIACEDGTSVIVSAGATEVIEGDVTVRNSLDAALLTGVRRITGTLVVDSEDLTAFSLPSLEQAFAIDINAPNLVDLNLTGLTLVDDRFALGFSSVSDLGGLSSLAQVDGALIIWRNSVLTDLSGLDALTTVRSLEVSQLSSLDNLNGMPSLTSADVVVIYANPSLQDVSAMASLDAVFGLVVSQNPNLSECDLRALASSLGAVLNSQDNANPCEPVPAACTSASLGCIVDCAELDDFTCARVWPGDYALWTQADADVLSAYDGVSGNLQVRTLLSNLAVPGLWYVGGRFEVYQSQITTLAGFSDLTNVGALDVQQSPNLSNLSGLEGIVELDSLNIHNVPSLDGLDNLSTVNGDIQIRNYVADVSALSSLTQVAGKLELSNIDASGGFTLPGLTTALDGLSIGNCGQLTSIDLPNLGGIMRGDIFIEGNAALTSISMPALMRARWVRLRSNPALDSVALTSIESLDRLQVEHNDALTTLNMPALRRIEDYLSIIWNASYPQCEGEQLRDQVLAAEGIVGSAVVGDNDVAAVCP